MEPVPDWKADRVIELAEKEPNLSDDQIAERLGISIAAIEQIRRRHRKGMTRRQNDRKVPSLICIHCGVEFKSRKGLSLHLRRRKEKGGRCPIDRGDYKPRINYVEDLLQAQKETGEDWTVDQDVEHFT